MRMSTLAVVGATSWGTTIANLLARQGHDVRLVARTEEEADRVSLGSPAFAATSHPAAAVRGVSHILWAVPSQTMRCNVATLSPHLDGPVCHLSVAKGLEVETGMRMTQVLADALPPGAVRALCALSGPNLATEIAEGLPAATVVASGDATARHEVQQLLSSPRFMVVASDDLIGVELAGALKNIVALGAGMMDGLGLGDNAKAAFIALTWSEVIQFAVAMGARESTLYGLAGLGDVVATCVSDLSRNHYVGCEVARGRALDDVLASMHHVAEGVHTARAVNRLGGEVGVETPIMTSIYRVLFEGYPVARAVARFTGDVQRRC
jgi:glycerol-3-phosphate dehydrogenase (NAD(P)+)